MLAVMDAAVLAQVLAVDAEEVLAQALAVQI